MYDEAFCIGKRMIQREFWNQGLSPKVKNSLGEEFPLNHPFPKQKLQHFIQMLTHFSQFIGSITMEVFFQLVFEGFLFQGCLQLLELSRSTVTSRNESV
jgi:hypothetical protein